jgi:O-acetyl-ADP-ribose deacetylase (regulator of RNase III)
MRAPLIAQRIGSCVVEVVRGDLLEEHADAIVNAANGHLAHGGGVAAAIASAAGEGFDEESAAFVQAHGVVPVGSAVATSAGSLEFKHVIHAVGPVFGEGDEERKLASAIESALRCADEHGCRTVSLPAISSGIFAVPFDVCARAYVLGTLARLRTGSPLERIAFVIRDETLAERVVSELERAVARF